MRPAAGKIVPEARALEIAGGWRDSGLSVAVAYGRFDLMEAAHVRALGQVKGGAERLAVQIASDRSAMRPVLGEAERARLVAALRIVDLVTIVPAIGVEAVDVDHASTLVARIRERQGG